MKRARFRIRGGKVLGKDHAWVMKNCQDSYHFISRDYLIGAVSDGCGSGHSSELAGLSLPFVVVSQSRRLLNLNVRISQIPSILFCVVVRSMREIVRQIHFSDENERTTFIANHMLATMIGFVIDPKEGVVFECGDGVIRVNNDTKVIDYGNKSPYLAYHLIPREHLDQSITLFDKFNVTKIDPKTLDTLVIATDGFNEQMIERMLKESQSGPLGIQLWMNLINSPRNPRKDEGYFFDDAACIVAEKIKDG